MPNDLRALRSDRNALIEELRLSGAEIRGAKILCPFHADTTPSGSVVQGDDGAWRFKCFSCGVVGDVIDLQSRRTGTPVADLLASFNAPPLMASGARRAVAEKSARRFESIEAINAAQFNGSTREDTYPYTNPTTKAVDMLVVRYQGADGKKSFFQFRPADGGGFEMKAPEKPWPIFNRKRIVDADTVIAVEGEKCVVALHKAGVIATTSPGGSSNAASADWTPLAGKTVYLWPDNDAPGEKYMKEVAAILETLSPRPRLFWINAAETGLPDKGDAADMLAGHAAKTPEEQRDVIEEVLSFAAPMGPGSEIKQLLDTTISGQRRAVVFPEWACTSTLSKALFPETLTLLCGAAGASKSFWLLDAVIGWVQANVPVAVFNLEGSRAFHLNRALAMLSGNAGVLDDKWLRENEGPANEIFDRHSDMLNRIGQCIHTKKTRAADLRSLTDWMTGRAEAGDRIIIIDPISLARTGNMKPWDAADEFCAACESVAVQHQCSVILVTHPKKESASGSVGLNDLAGGAGYARSASTVFWLECIDEKIESVIQGDGQRADRSVNRVLHLCKTRYGRGQGRRIGFLFDPKSLRSTEIGTIVKKPRAAPKPQPTGAAGNYWDRDG